MCLRMAENRPPPAGHAASSALGSLDESRGAGTPRGQLYGIFQFAPPAAASAVRAPRAMNILRTTLIPSPLGQLPDPDRSLHL